MTPAKTLAPEVFTEDHPWWKEFVAEFDKRSNDDAMEKLWRDIGDLQSDAQIHLENYCAEHGDGYNSHVPWTECPECEQLYRLTDIYQDYLCWRCRSTDA
jgi:hypothetical protein